MALLLAMALAMAALPPMAAAQGASEAEDLSALLDVPDASPSAAAAPDAVLEAGEVEQRTQAGCACARSWRDAAGGVHSGCANPNGDANGAWCAVDRGKCLGYYASFTDDWGSTVYFDYCGEVRERTSRGCLCAAEWRVAGAGKEGYRDRCASPDREGEGARKCRVDAATCPPGAAAALEDGYDACGPGAPERWATPAVVRGRSFNNCTCLGEWSYVYPASGDGATPAVNRTLYGCANPDGDPVGQWCAVDADSCARFAGYFRPSAEAPPVAYDYCSAPRPAPLLQRAGGCGPGLVPEFGQCGGKGDCNDYGCGDEPWAGACCAGTLECSRQDPFYWQCLPRGDKSSDRRMVNTFLKAIGRGGDDSADGDGNVVGGAGGLDLPALSGDGLASLKPRAPGARVDVALGFDFPFERLQSDVGERARFVSEVSAWLKKAAGPAEFVYGAGVDQILQGGTAAAAAGLDAPVDAADGPAGSMSAPASPEPAVPTAGTVVRAHVVFVAGAPLQYVNAAPKALSEAAAGLFKSARECDDPAATAIGVVVV